ncbi:MAG: UDP-N-acetylmuramoyl-L-alanine--D-glutamate ligase [Actinomycetota bacterium]
MSGRFVGERAVVVGAGVAGAAAARVLAAEGATVRVTEARPETEIVAASALRAEGVELLAGGHDPSHLDGATLVVTGPGVPEAASVLGWARARGLPLWGEMELGARLVEVPYVAVTGTNGKTTTTGMITACLRAAGLDATACGNIGHPFPEAARERHQALVVECSSFQLRLQESFHPRVSVLLNLAPDHLDWHGSFEAYAEAKARIFARQGPGDAHVGNRDDAEAARRSAGAPCDVAWFRSGPPADGEVGYDAGVLRSRLPVGRVGLGPADLGKVEGSEGLRADAAAAAAAALVFGVSSDAVREGLARFEPAAHRGETVAVADGVRFIDDSKATNVHAALAAIDGVDDAVLIAGGTAKGVDLAPLATRAARLRAIVAIGEAAPDLVSVFDGLRPVVRAASIEEAVQRAFDFAERSGCVLLAPACASWDQFSGYAERGDRFAAAARAMQREVGARGSA